MGQSIAFHSKKVRDVLLYQYLCFQTHFALSTLLNTSLLPGDSTSALEDISLRFHAIRQGGYYLSMDPTMEISWTNVEKFVHRAILTPFDDYDGYGDINIIKAYELAPQKIYESLSKKEDMNLSPLTDAKLQEIKIKKEQEQRRKELKRREQMDKKMREGIFEEEVYGDVNDNDDNVDDDLDDEEVMELV